MAKEELTGEYFHIYNRGVLKRDIFLDHRDTARFLFTLLHFQSPLILENLGRPTSAFVRSSTFNISADVVEQIVSDRFVEVLAFALMSNHFHILLREVEETGVSKFMHRLSTSFTKYFNVRHKQSGHLFQGRYKKVLIQNNNQLIYTSAYIHKNPQELKNWKEHPEKYPWSSYQDLTGQNRWSRLLTPDVILEQFASPTEYYKWVKDTSAKEIAENLDAEEIMVNVGS